MSEYIKKEEHPVEKIIKCPPDALIGSYLDQSKLVWLGLSYLISKKDVEELGCDEDVFSLAMQLLERVLFEDRESELFKYLEEN